MNRAVKGPKPPRCFWLLMSACSLITSSIPLNNAVRYWDLMNALQRINRTSGGAGVSFMEPEKNGTWSQFPQCPIIKYWEPNQQQKLSQSKGEDPGVSSQQHPEPWMGAAVPGGGMDPLGCAMGAVGEFLSSRHGGGGRR